MIVRNFTKPASERFRPLFMAAQGALALYLVIGLLIAPAFTSVKLPGLDQVALPLVAVTGLNFALWPQRSSFSPLVYRVVGGSLATLALITYIIRHL